MSKLSNNSVKRGLHQELPPREKLLTDSRKPTFMPKRKYSRSHGGSRKRRKRSHYRRRSSGRSRRLNRGSRSGPFPRKAIVTLRYSDTTLLQPTLANFAHTTYLANSIYTPRYLVSTHQPYGRDTLATIYNNYKVLSSKCTAEFVSQGGGPGSQSTVGVQLTSGITPNATTSLRREVPDTSWKNTNAFVGARAITKVKKSFNTARFFSTTRGAEVQSQMGTNPSEQAYFHVWGMAMDPNTALPDDILATVTITYKVLLSDPIALGT